MSARISVALDLLARFGEHASELPFAPGYWGPPGFGDPEELVEPPCRSEESPHEVHGQLDQ
jgi:hypothetical protein